MDYATFPKTGFVRLSQILAPNGPIPVAKSTWWQGVKEGRFPAPQKLGPRTTVWLAEDIRSLYEPAETSDAFSCGTDSNAPRTTIQRA